MSDAESVQEDQNHKVICDALQDISREVGSALSASKSLASLLQKVKVLQSFPNISTED